MVVFLSDFVISWRRQRVVPQVCFSYKLLTYFDHESMQRVLSELFVFPSSESHGDQATYQCSFFS